MFWFIKIDIILSSTRDEEENITEEVRIVPDAWNTIKKHHAARCAVDSKYKRDYERKAERLAEQQTRSLARTFASGGKGLRDLREIPGFAVAENEVRAKNAMQVAILNARKRSGLRQVEIAARMGIPQSNVSRIEHQTDALTFKTFAAYLRACGFGFKVSLCALAK